MKKLFYVLLLGITSLSLTSCLSAGANRTDMSLPAVVSYNKVEGVPSILTAYGEFAAPTLASTDLTEGACIGAEFTLDWDSQPANAKIDYVSDLTYEHIEESPAQRRSDFDETEAVFPVDDVLFIQALAVFTPSPILDGKLFLRFTPSDSQQQNRKYSAIVKPYSGSSLEEEANVYNVYLMAQKTDTPNPSNTTFKNVYAIDMHEAIRGWGTEDFIGEPPVKYAAKLLKIRLLYCKSLNGNNVPVYELFQFNGNQSVITLAILI